MCSKKTHKKMKQKSSQAPERQQNTNEAHPNQQVSCASIKSAEKAQSAYWKVTKSTQRRLFTVTSNQEHAKSNRVMGILWFVKTGVTGQHPKSMVNPTDITVNTSKQTPVGLLS